MDLYDATEQAFKNGYESGYKAGMRSAVGGDVVSVVRCKDCDNICEGTSRPICVNWGSWCDPDGWCYRGERRAEDGK